MGEKGLQRNFHFCFSSYEWGSASFLELRHGISFGVKCHSYPLSIFADFYLPISRSSLSNRKLTLYDTRPKYLLQGFFYYYLFVFCFLSFNLHCFCRAASWFFSLAGSISVSFMAFAFAGLLLMAQNHFTVPLSTVPPPSFYFSPGLAAKSFSCLSSQVCIPGTLLVAG